MRILHLVSYSLYSGPLPSTLGLALAQRQRGHEVYLAYDSKRGAFNTFEEPAEPVMTRHRLQPPKALTLSAKSNVVELWRDVRTLRGMLKQERFDVLHVHLSHDHGIGAVARTKAWKGAIVRTFHARRSLLKRPGQSWLSRRAAAYIVRCEAHRDLLLQNFKFVGAKSVTVVPGSIDPHYFVPAQALDARRAARKQFGLPNDAVVLGHVALMANRGQFELVDAVSKLSEVLSSGHNLYILFVGSGEREHELRHYAQSSPCHQHIRFAGYLQGQSLLSAYAAMDAAFCAQAGNDGSARAALEAMASGLPVIAVQEDALAELALEQTGYAVASREPMEIAMALKAFFIDAKERRWRGERAREFIVDKRQFTQEAMVVEQVYEQALMHLHPSPGV